MWVTGIYILTQQLLGTRVMGHGAERGHDATTQRSQLLGTAVPFASLSLSDVFVCTPFYIEYKNLHKSCFSLFLNDTLEQWFTPHGHDPNEGHEGVSKGH